MSDFYEELIEGIPPEIRIRSACTGQWRAFVESEAAAGLASLLLDEKQGAAPSREASEWVGRPLRDAAAGLLRTDREARAIGCAALNAWYNRADALRALSAAIYPPRSEEGDIFRLLADRCVGKIVSTVGHFPGCAALRDYAALRIFEKEPRPGDLPEEAEETMLPGSDVVFITGMTITNHTLPCLLELCRGSCVILTGPSVPLTPILLSHGVSVLSGTLTENIPACHEAVLSGGGKAIWEHLGKAVLRK